MSSSYHRNRTICLDFQSESYYQECLEDPLEFKQHLERMHQHMPEVFPAGMEAGWILYGYAHSKKQALR